MQLNSISTTGFTVNITCFYANNLNNFLINYVATTLSFIEIGYYYIYLGTTPFYSSSGDRYYTSSAINY